MYTQSALRAETRHRSSSMPQSAPAAVPADPRAELQHLFKSYDAACLDFDADAAAGFYDLPCLLTTRDGNAGFTARGELRAGLARAFAGYRQQGLIGASLAALAIDSLSDGFAQARATWSLGDARGRDVVNLGSLYTLRRTEGPQGRWRIVHAVVFDAAERPTRRPRAGLLSLR